MMSLVEFFSQPVWHRLGLTLVHFLWQGLAVAVIVCAAVRVPGLKRGNPRYGAYLFAFVVMAVSPLLTFTVLDVPPLPARAQQVPTQPVSLAPGLLPKMESSGSVAHSLSAQPRHTRSDNAPTADLVRPISLRQRFDSTLQASLPWALVCWMGGVLILSVRLLLGFLGICRWRRDLEPPAKDLQARVARLSERLGLPGFASVFISRRAPEVVALGYLRPMVLLPAAFVAQMPTEMLEAIVAHELAHIRRFDLWINLAQRIVETLLFYHPAVWWLSSRLRNERELCCDELAVGATGERLVYASALELAGRVRLATGRPALALGYGQDKRSTLGRVRHVLGLPPTPANSRYWLAGVIAFLLLVLLMMGVPSSLTARAKTDGLDLNDVLAKYDAARAASPHRYLMVVRNERNLWVAYRDGPKLYRAKYYFARLVDVGRRMDAEAAAQERAKAGDTIPSLLAWANSHTPENVEAYDGTQGATLNVDGYGRLQSYGKTRRPPSTLNVLSVHTLQSLGWPDMGMRISSYRIVTSDRYALENGLLCVEEQHQVTSSRDGRMAEITRFYLNPTKDYLCQRMHEGNRDYARQITKYGQTADGRWYPLQLDEFGNRSSPEPISDTPSAVDIVFFDTNPTFPEGIFDPDALLARYASQRAANQAGTPPLRSAEPDASRRRVAGQVVAGDTGQPVGGALVRVAVPAADMRFTRVAAKQITQNNGTKSTIYETRTDPNGRFDLLVPGGGSLSLDALAPGYGTAAEHFSSDPTLLMLSNTAMSGALRLDTSKLTIRLPRAAYVAGIVKNARGAPAAGVPIRAQTRRERSTRHLASAETNDQGRFEIFDFPLQPQPGDVGELVFMPATAVPVTLSGLYDLSPEKRTSLEITLPRGVTVTGLVLDAEGRAAAGVTVEATRESILKRQTTTDAKGHFELAGLEAGPVRLRAHATGLGQRTVQLLDLTDRDQNITLKMVPVEMKGQLKPVQLFGMQLVDVTPELKEVYDLYRDNGVLILDPGANSARLDIGELKKGYCFWIIGDKNISDLKEMVSELLQQLAPPWTPEPGRPGVPLRRVHVVYMARKGTSTKHMVLTPEDVAELRELAQKLGSAAAGN